VGPYGSIDLLFGGEIKIQVAKQQDDGRTVALSVTDPCDPMLQGYNPVGNHGAGSYTDRACPGKVDAYRFMTFYLPPSADNATAFESDVVDQEWLKSSSDPNAVALRGASTKDSGVWRVLHRVTYVSRVPPAFDTNPSQTLAPPPLPPIDVEDNAYLIGLVQQALGPNPPTGTNVGAAVAKVLAPSDGMSPSVLGTLVPWWASFLQRARSGSNAAAAAALNAIMVNTVRYFQSGYAGGALPVVISRS
jgi:large repetitive protein